MSLRWMAFVRLGLILNVPFVVADTFDDFDAGAREIIVVSEI